VVGDVTDPAAVQGAVRGCEAVVHAASVYSLDSRDAGRIRQVNVRGTDVVLGVAHRAGLDPIVYVSSIVALLPPNGQTLTPDSPPGHPPGPYLGSKTEAEQVARHYQEAGAPVVITYPGAIYGSHDPHLATGSGGCATSSRAASRSPRPAATWSRMCAMWQQCTPRSWSPAGGPLVCGQRHRDRAGLDAAVVYATGKGGLVDDLEPRLRRSMLLRMLTAPVVFGLSIPLVTGAGTGPGRDGSASPSCCGSC
jgi:hypothetical protein